MVQKINFTMPLYAQPVVIVTAKRVSYNYSQYSKSKREATPPGLKTGVDFRGQVCKGVTCFGVTCFGLKKGQDLDNRTAHPLPPRCYRQVLIFFLVSCLCI